MAIIEKWKTSLTTCLYLLALTWDELLLLVSFSFLAKRFFFLWRGLDSRIISSSSKVGSQFSLPFWRGEREVPLSDQSLSYGVSYNLDYIWELNFVKKNCTNYNCTCSQEHWLYSWYTLSVPSAKGCIQVVTLAPFVLLLLLCPLAALEWQ